MKAANSTEVRTEKILNFLMKHPKSDAKKIEKATGIAFIQVYSIAGRLQKENKIVEKNKMFSLTAAARSLAKKATNYGRDFSKFVLNGEKYRKGQLVLAIVSDYAKKHNCTSAQLKKVFSDDLVPMYGVIAPAVDAKRASTKKKRYFVGADQLIQLKDGKFAVTNQISEAIIQKFLPVAKNAGYRVK
jgi:hypothetical protein